MQGGPTVLTVCLHACSAAARRGVTGWRTCWLIQQLVSVVWGRVGDTGFSSAARRTRADARSVLGARQWQRTCMTVLWKKMAAGDLSWWPHACAAAPPPPRAEFCNFWVSFYRSQCLRDCLRAPPKINNTNFPLDTPLPCSVPVAITHTAQLSYIIVMLVTSSKRQTRSFLSWQPLASSTSGG